VGEGAGAQAGCASRDATLRSPAVRDEHFSPFRRQPIPARPLEVLVFVMARLRGDQTDDSACAEPYFKTALPRRRLARVSVNAEPTQRRSPFRLCGSESRIGNTSARNLESKVAGCWFPFF
jgi:hypothetical protein